MIDAISYVKIIMLTQLMKIAYQDRASLEIFIRSAINSGRRNMITGFLLLLIFLKQLKIRYSSSPRSFITSFLISFDAKEVSISYRHFLNVIDARYMLLGDF